MAFMWREARLGSPVRVVIVLAATATCGGSAAGPARSASGGVAGDAGPGAASDSGSGNDGGAAWPAIDPTAFGKADLSHVTVAAFSQVNVDGSDPQVLALTPDLVPRAWGQWDTSGLKASDYAFAYPRSCQAAGVTFVGGLTASVMFVDEMSTAAFDDEVGRDASDNPVPHPEIVAGAYRGALASPGFRQMLIAIAELQIDGGVDGLFFDEVNSSYIGANYSGNEGFDDHDVADFGRFLCRTQGASASTLAGLQITAADGYDCTSADPGAAFDYRGYLARLGVAAAPLGSANPLAALWGTTTQNRPDPSLGTFVQVYPSLVYWQSIVATVRNYARAKYGKEILVTANGIFPFVDFQSVGLYDYNPDGPGPKGFDYAPLTGTAPNVHYDGTQSFMPAFASLKASSDRIVGAVGGQPVPLLLFLDWPTDSINRYYSMPTAERQDYIRVVLAEAYAYGEWFSLPLATTTDTSTATALGMMGFFQSIRAFYESHAALFHGALPAAAPATVAQPSIAIHTTTLPDGSTVVHLVNHAYSAGFIAQQGVTIAVPLAQAPSSVTLASPDFTSDQTASFSFASGQLTVNVGTLLSSVAVAIR
jgi:hypothetical protein